MAGEPNQIGERVPCRLKPSRRRCGFAGSQHFGQRLNRGLQSHLAEKEPKTRLTLVSDDKSGRFFTVIKFSVDETSGVALALKGGVPT